MADGAALVVRGRLPAPAIGGRGFLRVEGGLGAGCRGDIPVLLTPGRPGPPAGALLAVRGRWRTAPGAASADYAGALRADRWSVVAETRVPPLAAVRGAAAATLHRVFGARGPLANALVLSRTEGMEPEIKDAFARSGIAHLLSISGFHVAVVAALLLGMLRALRVPPRIAPFGGLIGVWAYVFAIGAPDAGVRSAILFTLLLLARAAGRPLAAEGALAAAFLALAVIDPGGPGRPGFQLSFAGALGLARFAPALDAAMGARRAWLPAGLRSGLCAGVGATLASLPIVAWHFERVSLVGIPGTMVAGPLVAVAIPGVLLVLLLDPVSPALAAFVAGGTDWVLAALVLVVDAFARPAWASVAVPRGWVLAGAVGMAAAVVCLAGARGIGRAVRGAVLAAGALAALLLAPVARGVGERGTVEIEMIDVGQGDAILLRSPAGRWALVDAGPRSDQADAGLRRVLPELRRRGVRRLELLLLTHPHLDHVGGAPAVLRGVRVGRILDPGLPQGSSGYVDVLEAAGEVGVPWTVTARGTVIDLDGMELEVLHPLGPPASPRIDPNEVSLVLLVRHGAFTALLTGDAPAGVEASLGDRIESVQVLKVGHHGSSTSSPQALLDRLHPQLALISSGRGNSFGHPKPEVVRRLQAAGAQVLRTDLNGTIRVRGRPDGSWSVAPERPD